MDGDPLKKVQPGDAMQIRAPAYNAFVDAARDFQDRAHDLGPEGRAAFRQATIARVRNSSGAARAPFEVLGLGAALPTPTDNLDLFRERVGFEGVTPDIELHAGKFCVLLEPAAAGAVAFAAVAGVCPVKVDVTDAAHEYADVADGEGGYLASAARGAAQILWKQDGTGQKWAIVRLGSPPAPQVCWQW